MMIKSRTLPTSYLFLSIWVFISTLSVSAQSKSYSIAGKVLDEETDEPIFFVNVFLSNTTVGTTTDENGHYLIKNALPGAHDLVFQHMICGKLQLFSCFLLEIPTSPKYG